MLLYFCLRCLRRMELNFPIRVHPSQCDDQEEESRPGEEAQLLELEHFTKAQPESYARQATG